VTVSRPVPVTEPAEVPLATSVHPARVQAQVHSRGDPERVNPEEPRDKKSARDTQVVHVQADSLLGNAPSRDNPSDIYFIITVAGICAMAVGLP